VQAASAARSAKGRILINTTTAIIGRYARTASMGKMDTLLPFRRAASGGAAAAAAAAVVVVVVLGGA
jgi:hypothetical protein